MSLTPTALIRYTQTLCWQARNVKYRVIANQRELYAENECMLARA